MMERASATVTDERVRLTKKSDDHWSFISHRLQPVAPGSIYCLNHLLRVGRQQILRLWLFLVRRTQLLHANAQNGPPLVKNANYFTRKCSDILSSWRDLQRLLYYELTAYLSEFRNLSSAIGEVTATFVWLRVVKYPHLFHHLAFVLTTNMPLASQKVVIMVSVYLYIEWS